MGYLVRLALIIGAAALFAGCGRSQPPIGTPGTIAPSRAAATHAGRDVSLRGYYLAKFATVVGSGLPFSSLCLKIHDLWHLVFDR